MKQGDASSNSQAHGRRSPAEGKRRIAGSTAAQESYEARVDCVRERLVAEGIAALVVFGAADCRYLTGFTGEAASVVVGLEGMAVITDPRFTIQAKEQARGAQVVIYTTDRDELLPGVIRSVTRREAPSGDAPLSIAVDPTHLDVKRWEGMKAVLEDAGFAWSHQSGWVAECRRVKHADELAAVRESGALVVEAFAYLESSGVAGKTEREVALEIEMLLRRMGSEGVAFPFIVAGGPRGAMPHAEPTDAVIEVGQLVVFDIGTVVGGYCSDITRTYGVGEVGHELREVYEQVRTAQAAAVEAVKAGVACSELDRIARDSLASAGLDEYFVHSLGHGVGLEVHEEPSVSRRSDCALQQGMVVTIEPGVYLPGRAGVRIEDTVIVGEERGEIVTEWPRELRFLS